MQRYESRMNVMEWAERKKGEGKTEVTGMGGGGEVCSPPTGLVERVAVNVPLYSKTVSV